MELQNDYQNFDDQPRGDRKKQENLTPEHSVQAADPVRGKCPPLVFYILLGLSILLSMVVLGTAVILFTGISEETSLSLAELRTNISQLQDITQMLSKMKMSDTDLKVEISQLKSTVTGISEETSLSLAELRTNISQLQDITGISEQTSRSLAELRAEISQLKKKLINFQCPDQWKKFQQNCYYFLSNEKNWLEAQRSCASMDANLVVINKAEEQAFIQGLLQNGYHWIGLSDSTSEGDWHWVDGTDYTSSVKFWDNSQPNDRENENCVTMLSNGKWHDWPCNSTHPSICEKSA